MSSKTLSAHVQVSLLLKIFNKDCCPKYRRHFLLGLRIKSHRMVVPFDKSYLLFDYCLLRIVILPGGNKPGFCTRKVWMPPLSLSLSLLSHSMTSYNNLISVNGIHMYKMVIMTPIFYSLFRIKWLVVLAPLVCK